MGGDMVNLYELIGLSMSASENQIRQHIMQHHAAGTLDDEHLEEAKKWLLNSSNREQYDQKLTLHYPELIFNNSFENHQIINDFSSFYKKMNDEKTKEHRGFNIAFLVIGLLVLLLMFVLLLWQSEYGIKYVNGHQKIADEGNLDSQIPEYFKKNQYYTQHGAPELFKKWGNGVDRINSLVYPAAKFVVNNHACDAVSAVEVSDIKSSAKNGDIVFSVDCQNGQRFYASEDDINTKAQLSSVHDMKIDEIRAISHCDLALKLFLMHPETYKRHPLSTNVYAGDASQIIVDTEFTSKSGIGIQAKHRGRCVMDSAYENVKISELEQVN